MPPPPRPIDETSRLAALQNLGILDSQPDAEFDALVQAASLVCGTPIALISLVDADRQWLKATTGLPGVTETPRDQAFCGYTILGDAITEVADATSDPRFVDNPLVTGNPDIRFYAGVPLQLEDGSRVGSLCVIDRTVRILDDRQREVLRCLGRAAARALESWRARRLEQEAAHELERTRERFRRLYERTPAILQSVDSRGCIRAVSDRWLARFGYTREEVIGRPAASFLTKHSFDTAVVAARERLLRQGHVDDLHLQMVDKAGAVFEVLMSVVVEDAGDGDDQRRLAVIEDLAERQEVERELRDERRRLASLIAATDIGTWEWHVPSGKMRINERWAAICGLTIADLAPVTADSCSALVHPDEIADLVVKRDLLFSGATERYNNEIRMRHRDGHYVWVRSRGAIVERDSDGTPIWVFGTTIDISQRKAQELALRESQEFLAQTSRLAGVGGWAVDLGTGEVTWSDEARRIHGVAADYQPTMDGAIDAYAPAVRAGVRAAVAAAIAEGKSFDLELPLTRNDGRPIWIRSIGSATRVDGVATRLSGALQDVTAQVADREAIRKAHERTALAADSGGIGIWDRDLRSGGRVWDPWMYRLFGKPGATAEDPAAVWHRHVHEDDRQAAEQAMQDAIDGIRSYATEFRVIWDDGSVHHLKAFGHVVHDATGAAIRMVGTNWDITEQRQLATRLVEQHELLRVTLDSIADGVITSDSAGRIVWLNPVAERLTGWSAADALGRPMSQVFHIVNEANREPAPDPVAACIMADDVAGLANDTMLVARDRQEYAIQHSAAPIRNAAGEMFGVVLVFHDVSEQRQLSRAMSYRAAHDALTGLISRSEFDARLSLLLKKAQTDGSRHALLFIDLDQFKLVNDACGHTAGDQLLQQIARLLSELVRASDVVARLGGDEFAVILDHCSIDQAQRLGQRICDRIEDYRFVHDDRRFRVGASIGLVPVDDRWSSTSALLQASDQACYAAKEAGRHRVHIWSDSDEAMRARSGESQWATRLAQALDEDRFVLFAQQIRPLRAAPPGVHAEVLLRMVEADGTLIPPGAFLPAAERFHLASRIDRWVLQTATAWMSRVPLLQRLELLCVNLSGQSVGDRAFHRWAVETLQQAGPAICSRLCLEITETAAVTNFADAALFIDEVRAVGVRVALDDFGAGASSFGYLKTLPVDFLKIDGQFIRDLLTDPLDEAAVRCFADVASVVGMQTVAEFVDNPDVLAKLSLMGVDFAQGFLIHRPAPIGELFSMPGPRLADVQAAE